MGELLARVVPLALGAAVSPTVLALQLVIVEGRRAAARGLAYCAGVGSVLALLTVAGLLVHHTGVVTPVQREVTRALDTTIGALLLLLALGTVLRARARGAGAPVDAPPPDPSSAAHAGLASAALVGAAMMLTSFSTILLYLPAMHEVAAARVEAAAKAVAVAVAVVITSLPATLPLLARVALPGPSAQVFDRLHAVVSRHQRTIGVTVEVVFGAVPVVKGVR